MLKNELQIIILQYIFYQLEAASIRARRIAPIAIRYAVLLGIIRLRRSFCYDFFSSFSLPMLDHRGTHSQESYNSHVYSVFHYFAAFKSTSFLSC